MKSKQQGITLIGFLVVLMVVGFFAFMGMKLFPAYSEYYGVVKSMEQMVSESGSKAPDQIRADLIKKMDFQYVGDSTISPKDITIKRSGNSTQLSVSYDKRIPFMYNIDFLVHFEKSVVMQGASEG